MRIRPHLLMALTLGLPLAACMPDTPAEPDISVPATPQPASAAIASNILDLGDLGFGSGSAEGINANGQIVGRSLNDDALGHAFLW